MGGLIKVLGRYGAMVCHYESGERLIWEPHNAWWRLRLGDGQPPSSAFYINSTNDLYACIQLNEMVTTNQSRVYHKQKPMEVIKVQDAKTEQKNTGYFDGSAQFRRGIFNTLESGR